MTMSCICVDFEKQMILRTKRLMRVRSVKSLRSMFGFVASFAQRALEGELPPIGGIMTQPVC